MLGHGNGYSPYHAEMLIMAFANGLKMTWHHVGINIVTSIKVMFYYEYINRKSQNRYLYHRNIVWKYYIVENYKLEWSLQN